MEEVRGENGRFVAGHPGQKPVGAKSELRKKVLLFRGAMGKHAPTSSG